MLRTTIRMLYACCEKLRYYFNLEDFLIIIFFKNPPEPLQKGLYIFKLNCFSFRDGYMLSNYCVCANSAKEEEKELI